MKILVTGVAGFIGYSLACALLARGDEVIGIDVMNDYYDVRVKEARLAALREAGGPAFRFHKVDFADYAALTQALADEQFDRIAHLGAQAGVRYSIVNPFAYAQSNLVGHLNLLEVARHREVEHMVYASSSSVYGGNAKLPFAVEDRVDHPLSLYAATKKADELTDEEITGISNALQGYNLEGDLRREVAANIRRLIGIGCYRGSRHRKGLPVRGQRTSTNARTRKGPRKTVGAVRGKEARSVAKTEAKT